MPPLIPTLLALTALISTSAAKTDQKLLGPSFELPTNIPSNQAVKDAVANITNSLNQAIRTGNSPFGRFNSSTTSFSLTVVSQSDADPIVDFHHTSGGLNVSAGSTTKVTADSIYRIGSVSKLFTVYALLLNNGIEHWNHPVTDYVPELRDAAKHTPPGTSAIDHVQWDQVTVGALASQLTGIGRDYNNGDMASQSFPWVESGLPELLPQDIPACAGNSSLPPCNRQEYFQGYIKRHPVFAPYAKALYSNAAYRILAYVIEAITKRSYADVLDQDVFKPLGMKHSSTDVPIIKGVGVIPDGEPDWYRDFGDEVPTGGLLSSTNDLAAFGRAIFANRQLSSMETLRWMKPNSLTSSTSLAVGAPWEIVRTRTDIRAGTLVDLYTKSGSIGAYESLIILVPDYQVTFAIIAGGPDASLAETIAGETAVQALLPALERASRAEACQKFCGEYRPSLSSSLNSSLVLAVDDRPGLLVKQWISRGSDLVLLAQAYANATRGGHIQSVRLYPAGIKAQNQAAYRAVFQTVPYDSDPSTHFVFDPAAEIWATPDNLVYGAIAVDDFVFRLDDQGAATAVEPRVLREVLERTKGL
ncbi:Beta-lactamase-like protein sdnR [Cladobotryum mycophilum]|uniref:Beta-lactamase-like protein sdnR n=1 Tax=Cladobotryum mycophilum TaxID=491253 RepID=A0ABR0SXF7_9HYPO